jgi:DNA-binding response OmpR family regulator
MPNEEAVMLKLGGAAAPRRAVVLLVDDDEVVLTLLQATLARLPHQVIVARNGAEALTQAREHRPDLVVLDVTMPILDGVEVCRRLRADDATRAARIVLLSACAQPDDQARGIDAGADAYLTKPFRPGELLQRLTAQLAG